MTGSEAKARRRRRAAVAQKVGVSSWDEALDAIDGKEYTLDGVHGRFKVDRSRAHDTRVTHEPSARGRRSEAYLETKRELRDDWSSDLTNTERLADIASEFVRWEGP